MWLMRSARRIALAVCLGLCSSATNLWAACDGTPAASGVQRLEVGGTMRTFVLRAPTGHDGRTAAPVVFAFHPFGMNAQYMQSRAPIGRSWPEAYVVYPEGMAQAATSLVPSWQGRPGELGDRDLAFFDAMLAWLDARACVDRARVFVLGYSNGAGLAHLLACERSQAVAGAAIAAGRLSCAPSSAKPVVLSHGLQDRIVGYGMALEASKAWGAANGCAVLPKAGVQGCVVGDGCQAATTLCTHAGGHEYDPAFTKVAAEFFKAVPAFKAAPALKAVPPFKAVPR
jgi:polyhydroxybutyrate depolymerase